MTEQELYESLKHVRPTMTSKQLIETIVKHDPKLEKEWVIYGFWIKGEHPYGAEHERKYGDLPCGGCSGIGCRFCNHA